MPDEVPSIQREEFGQRQPLTVAIHHLIRDYPLGVGLFKEFIQNADDAGASEVQFILDGNTHSVGKLHHPNLARLSGPSLLVWNDAKFTDEDLHNIQHLGDSRKVTAPAKIGRFGLGFNCCYNVTDYPLLLARESLHLFDPHRTAEGYSDQSASGTCWHLNEALWNESRDLLSPFEGVGLAPDQLMFPETAFRLPLRNDDHILINGKIRSEMCSPEQIRSLIEEFRTIAPSVLIFLKNVLTVSFYEITPGAPTRATLLSIETLNADKVTAHRQKLAAFLQGDITTAFIKIEQSSEEDLRTIYNHQVRVAWKDTEATYDWLISTGIFTGQDDRMLNLARAMAKYGEKALPVAGVATDLSAGSAEKDAAPSGEVFCFLPLPDARGGAPLPVQINGFFDINSSRRGLTHEASLVGTVEEARGQWNRALLEEGVAEAHANLLGALVERNPAIDTVNFYQLWLDPSVPLPPPLGNLVESFYKACAGKSLLRSALGKWVKADELRLVDISIREPLLAERLASVASHDIPAHVLAGLKMVKHPIERITPAEVRDLYRVDVDPNCELAAAPKVSLANREWLGALAHFSFKDYKEPKEQHLSRAFSGLPFLLTADGKLHAFGVFPGTVFVAGSEERSIFREFPHSFIDEDHAKRSQLAEMPSLRLVRMTPEVVVANLKAVVPIDSGVDYKTWDPTSNSVPNESWLIEVVSYLTKQPHQWAPNGEQLKQCCLIPDQFSRLQRSGYAETPLLPTHPLSDSFRTALTAFGIGLIVGSEELVDQFSSLRRRYPSSIVWSLTASDLLDTLVQSAANLGNVEGKAKQLACEQILEFLSRRENFAAGKDFDPKSLAKLGTLAIFPTEAGELVSLTSQKCFLPSAVQGPQVALPIKLLKRGAWCELLNRLGVAELSVRSLIEQVLIPGYPGLRSEEQLTVLCWIRDHLDLALTKATGTENAFLATLRAAKLVRSSCGDLHAGGTLYFPNSEGVKNVLGDYAIFYDQALYQDDRERWPQFFERIGIARKPRPQDLVSYIIQLTNRLAGGADYEQTADRLTVILQHCVDAWSTLQLHQIVGADGKPLPLRDFLRTYRWCPPLRGQNSLRRLLVADNPPKQLFLLSELSPPIHGHLVGGIRPLMPIEQRETIPEGLRKLVPEIAEPILEDVIQHFIKILARYGSESRIDTKALKTPLKELYSYFGSLLSSRSVPGDDESEQDSEPSRIDAPPEASPNPLISRLREMLEGRATILVPGAYRFRPPREVFRRECYYLEPWRTVANYQEARVDAGLRALGRKEEPDFLDLCTLTVEIHAAPEKPIESRFISILGRIDELWPPTTDEVELFIIDSDGKTCAPTDVYFDDAEWLSGKVDMSILRVAHRSLPRSLVERLRIRLLSNHLKLRPTGAWIDSTNASFVERCHQFQDQLHSPEFANGLQRVINHSQPTGKLPELGWLRQIIISPQAQLRLECYIEDENGETVLGGIEDDIYWPHEGPGSRKVFVAESAISLLDVKLTQELTREIRCENVEELYLIKILGCKPAEIGALLDKLKVARIRESANNGESHDDPRQGSDFFDQTDETVSSSDSENRSVPLSASAESDVVSDESLEQATPATAEEVGADEVDTDEQQPSPDEDGEIETPEHHGGTRRPRSSVIGHSLTTEDEHSDRGQNPIHKRSPKQESTEQHHRNGIEKTTYPPSRGRAISYVITEEQSKKREVERDHANDELPTNKGIGDAAVQWVMQFEVQQNRKPKAMAHNQPGYDVESRAGIARRYIEVKGINGKWDQDGVPVSPTQFALAQEKGQNFWLYVVEYVLDAAKVQIHPIQDPASKVTQFRFDHGWSSLASDERKFQPLRPEPGNRLRFTDDDGAVCTGRIVHVSHPTNSKVLLGIRLPSPPDRMVWFDPVNMWLLPASEE